ncbi:hypothetical protein WK80_25810 [Burkholderia multivorans]|uniref:hypothetical protein n=1 Tax=Burkholderia multivorans TaxID=87883 RepID=UPI00075651CB|nr:hypothetical protein [Burkholderia multivorans]KVV19337.1 hypothetical protein WK80_25810 [Burkholderia multivorans]MBU9205211.1 hypothetical protein [Burkholderia multivorans]MCA8386116.1 hypothetical protein [Burkholderia multivorans]MCO8315858.1 hypothetical protein [Burkholderia multivorans]MCO8354195.1 hypothetical protein [Burkholderia multivorans]
MAALELIGYIIASLGGGAVVVGGLSAWLGKLWAERMLKEKQAQIDTALARANSALRIAERRHDIMYSALHEKRAHLISEVYTKLAIISNGFEVLQNSLQRRYQALSQASSEAEVTALFRDLPPEDAESLRQLQSTISGLWTIVVPNRIYFRPRTVKLLDTLLHDSRTAAHFYGSGAEPDLIDVLARALTWRRSYDNLQALTKELEMEFRSLLGVEQETETAA